MVEHEASADCDSNSVLRRERKLVDHARYLLHRHAVELAGRRPGGADDHSPRIPSRHVAAHKPLRLHKGAARGRRRRVYVRFVCRVESTFVDLFHCAGVPIVLGVLRRPYHLVEQHLRVLPQHARLRPRRVPPLAVLDRTRCLRRCEHLVHCVEACLQGALIGALCLLKRPRVDQHVHDALSLRCGALPIRGVGLATDLAAAWARGEEKEVRPDTASAAVCTLEFLSHLLNLRRVRVVRSRRKKRGPIDVRHTLLSVLRSVFDGERAIGSERRVHRVRPSERSGGAFPGHSVGSLHHHLRLHILLSLPFLQLSLPLPLSIRLFGQHPLPGCAGSAPAALPMELVDVMRHVRAQDLAPRTPTRRRADYPERSIEKANGYRIESRRSLRFRQV